MSVEVEIENIQNVHFVASFYSCVSKKAKFGQFRNDDLSDDESG